MKRVTVDVFADKFAASFKEYMANRIFNSDEPMHPLDIAIEISCFAEAFYHSTNAIWSMEK
jgi:hypothetical protein